MGLFSSVKKRFVIQLISIVLEEKRCNIFLKRVKNSKITHTEKRTFELESKDKLSAKVVNYLNELQEMYEQTYVALFLNTLGQGAIAGCSTGDYEKFGVDKKSVKSICIDSRFTIYASIVDINWIDKIFQNVGIDFIFSPFLVLYRFIKKDVDYENKDIVKLYILNSNNGLTIMIMNGKRLLYGSFFNLAKEENLLYEDFEEDPSSISELDEEIFEEFDIDDEDSDEIQDIDEQIIIEEDDIKSELSQKDARFIKYLDASLKEFYHSELYDSSFINSVKIYDDAGIDEGIIKHIENDLLLDISAENINILEVVSEIAEDEVLNHA